MNAYEDFEISHKNACIALNLNEHTLANKPLAYRIQQDGSRVSWAVDIVRAIKSKYPYRSLAEMKLHSALSNAT